MKASDKQAQTKRDLSNAERAIDNAFNTGRADRATITSKAHADAEEAVRLVGVAMEADEMADDAMRMSVIASQNADAEGIRRARTRVRDARKQAKDDHKAASKAARQAYDAIRFSAPNKLGFMRVIQVGFLLHIFSTLLVLWLTSRDAITYDSGTLFDWVMIILEGVGFWFFVNQYKIGKPYMIALGGVGIVYNIIVDVMRGSFSLGTFLGNTVFYLILVFYFLFSKRVDYVMVNDFSKHEGTIEREEVQINRKGWPFYRNLIMYFVIFSVFGHWMEAGMCQFIILGWVEGEYDPTNTMLWRDWLYPFPMEGMAVVIIAVALYPLYKWLQKKFDNRIIPYVLSFLANALTCSIIEFSMGLLINADYQLWDYRENFGNIMGQVCLQNAVAFGVAASIIAWFVYPLMERWIARLRPEIVNIAFVVIAVFGGILWSLYIIDPPKSLSDAQIAKQQLDEREQKTQEEKEGMALMFSIQEVSAGSARESVGESEYLTDEEKAKLDENLAEIQRRYEDMQSLLIPVEDAEQLQDAA
ncbi:MAG: putative ABC transporter permease [Atopobiaceae bacterium]|nr:putative ABC transporter permease [Atopobiaceae bacterium]